MSENKTSYSKETVCVHGDYNPLQHNRSRAVPLYQSSAFVYDSTEHAASLFNMDSEGFIYMRIGNPTVEEAEKRVAMLEGGLGAVGFASGMSALMSFILNFLKPGDHIAAANCLYGGSVGLFKDTLVTLGYHTTFFDPLKIDDLKKCLTEKTKLIWIENLANPTLVVPDLSAIASVAKENKIPLAVDNTIATPILSNPIKYGADFVYHSCTKYMEGHGGIIGGFVINAGTFEFDKERYPLLYEEAPGGKSYVEKYGKEAFLYRMRGKVLMNTGGCMAPFHAFLLIRGMESLHVRMERHCTNAMKIAEFLNNHPSVAWVCYPGLKNHKSHENASKYLGGYFGAMIGFGLKGGYEACKKFINNIKLLTHTTNIGDTKTLVIHPASTTHRNMTTEERQKSGIYDDFIRMSVGLENVGDLIGEIEKAMNI
ncbi:MAG TPA: O-acetylhomoserine aminocarboxypropyltransferase/cysteine synthase family protein [Chitinispirillaceae bacterium]|nr:O-acetylhomoserine aminocarboxypropyltransferase/cysteine synthase family protein [Chitinispirillaceae bacterium]